VINVERDRLILPALLVSTLSTYPPLIVTSVLLVEISQTLDTPLGVTGQLRTAISLTALLGSLIVAGLTNRFSYRRILIAGLTAVVVSSIVSAFSPNYTTLLIATLLTGIGIALTTSMTTTLVGEYYPRDERGKIIGLLGVGGGFAFLFGGVVSSSLAQYGGWRLAFLGFATLIGVLGLVFTLIFLPRSGAKGSGKKFTDDLRQIMGNDGAVRSLAGAVLASIAIQDLYIYCFSFLKETFKTGTLETGFIYTGTAGFFIAGSYITSRVINGLGPRKMTVIGLIGFSAFTFVYHFIPNLGLAVAAIMVGNLLEAIRFNGNTALSLDQAPSQKGAMMSLHSAASQLGYSIGAGVGGLILIYSNWSMMGIILPIIGICGSLVVFTIKGH
jgi:DHA1 family purine base/nucleoside efflux pump-like MFS transporter